MEVVIKKSDKKDKKYDATIDGKKTISFGAKGYSDFTLSKDKGKKEAYIARHKVNEDWSDPETAGFYAKHLLWNKPTFQDSFKDLKKKFKTITFTYKY